MLLKIKKWNLITTDGVNFLLKYLLSFLILFNSSFAWSDPSKADPATISRTEQPITIKMEVFENPDDFQGTDLSKSIPRAEENVVTFVNTAHAQQIKRKWGSALLNKINFRYLEYPVQELKKRFSEEVNYYKAEKTAMMVLAVLVGSTAVNFIFFADTLALSTKSFLVFSNAVLYAYLIVNIPRWQKVLRASEVLVEKLRRHRSNAQDSSEIGQIVGNLGANFAFFMVYNFTSQGIINWGDLSQLFNGDLLGLMLKNSILGMASTGVWDTTFRNWYLKGSIDKRKLDVFNWREAVVAGLLQSLAAAGHTAGDIGLMASGTLGAGALMFYSDKVRPFREKLSWIYSRGKFAFTNLALRSGLIASEANMCSDFLR